MVSTTTSHLATDAHATDSTVQRDTGIVYAAPHGYTALYYIYRYINPTTEYDK